MIEAVCSKDCYWWQYANGSCSYLVSDAYDYGGRFYYWSEFRSWFYWCYCWLAVWNGCCWYLNVVF